MLSEVARVICLLRICKCHDEHVATLLEWLHLIVAKCMSSGIGIMGPKIMHGVLVGILP